MPRVGKWGKTTLQRRLLGQTQPISRRNEEAASTIFGSISFRASFDHLLSYRVARTCVPKVNDMVKIHGNV